MISILTRKAIADVTQRKTRTLMIILGISIAVLGLTAVNAANELFGQEFFNAVAPADAPDMTFNVQSLPVSVATTIQQRPDVALLETRLQLFTHWHLSGNVPPATIEINGYQNWQEQLYSFQLKSGRLPGRGEIVMDARARFVQPIAIGDTVTVDDANSHAVALRVVGLAHADEYPSADTIGYMNMDGWEQLSHLSNTSNNNPTGPDKTPPPSEQILLRSRIQNVVSMEQSHREIARTLDQAHVVPFASSWSNPGDRDQIQLGITGLLTVVRVLAAIALVLVCLMILNTMTTLLAEQMKIIGTMKAIGGTRWRIIGSYLLSISIYGIIGTALGIGLGLWLCSQVTHVIAELGKIDLPPYQVSVWVIVTSLLVGLLTPVLAALFPLWLGTRITVHEAMNSYGVSNGGSMKAGRRMNLIWLPQTVALGLHGVLRKPRLTLLTMLALTISATMFMAIQITSTSLTTTIQENNNIYHSDLSVYLSDNPVPAAQILPAVQALPDVTHIESINSLRATLKGHSIELVALQPDTHFYQPEVTTGRWLSPRDQNTLVVSDIIAQRLNLHTGEVITLTTEAQSVTMTIIGTVHELYHAAALGDNSSQLGMAFTSLPFLNINLRHAPKDATTNLEIQARDTSPEALLHLKDQVLRATTTAKLYQAYIRYINTGSHGLTQVVIIYALFDTIACVVALVGLLSLSNTLAAAVLERRREIGILRSLGATDRQVGTVFWIQGLALALSAWTIGTLLGFPGGYAIVNVLAYFLIPLDLTIDPSAILATLIFIVIVSFIASFGPSLSASRVRIQETLRYE